MSKEILDSIEKINQDFVAFQKANKEANEQAIKGYVDPLLASQVEKLNEAISKAEDAKQAAEKAQAIAQSHRAVEQRVEDGKSKEQVEYRNAFVKFITKGDEGMTEGDKQVLKNPSSKIFGKSLSSGSDTAGGYFVLPEVDSEITRVINETSPIRSVARVMTISSDQYERMQNTDLATAVWADRDGAPSETDPQSYRKLSIKTNKIYAEPRISQDLLDDAFINIEQELISSVSESFSIAENLAFVSGDGVGQPRGFLDYTSGTSWGQVEQIVTGSAAALTFEGVINLVYGLKDGYLPRAKFMMKRSTVAAVRKLVDGNGNSIWQPGFGSEPPTLMGYPLVRAADMPAVGANALCMAFADFSQAYFIVDRLGTRILRDPYTAKPFVKFYTYKKCGAGINNFEAIKLHKCST